MLSPDNFWYPQGHLTMVDGRWRVKAYVGSETSGAGSEFTIGAITSGGNPAKEKLRELPPVAARATVRVTRVT